MHEKLASRRGFTLVEVLISAVIFGGAAYVVSRQLSLGYRSSRNLIGLKAVGQVSGAVPKAILRAVTGYYRAGPPCSVAGLRAALTANLPNGVRIAIPTGPIANLPDEHVPAAARCVRPFNPSVNAAGSLYFCVLLQPAVGVVGRDSLIGMQPAFGEFVFQANNTLTGAPVGCAGARGNVANTGANLTYTLHWGENGNEHRYSGMVSEPRI